MNKDQQTDADQNQATDGQRASAPSGVGASVMSEFLYLTPALKKLHALLSQAVVSGDIAQIVCGEEGSGKTLQLNQLLSNVQSERNICVIHASHVLGVKHIVAEINRCFFSAKNLNPTEIAHRFSESASGAGARLNHPLIIVDDAHNLSSFALDALLSLKEKVEESGGYLAVLLFAQPEIEIMLSSPSLIRFHDVICIYQMPVLDEDETWEYLHLLLNEYWGEETYSLTVNEAKFIYCKSDGIPGVMNNLMARMIRQHRHGHFITQFHKRPKAMISAALAMFSVIFIAILFSGEESHPPALPMSAALNLEGQSANRHELLASISKKQSKPVEIDKKQLPLKTSSTNIKEQKNQSKVTPSPSLPIKSVITAKPALAKNPENKAKSPAKPPAKNISTEIEKSQQSENPGVKSVTIKKEKSVPAATSLVAAATPGAEKVDLKKRVKPQAANDWLRAQIPDDYTIQLAASASEKAIIRFINKQPVLPDLRYVHVKRRGSDWYVVLYGAYQSVSDARRTIKNLSRSLTKNKPWVRRASAIQGLLAKPVVAPTQIPKPKLNPNPNPNLELEPESKSESEPEQKTGASQALTANTNDQIAVEKTPIPVESKDVP